VKKVFGKKRKKTRRSEEREPSAAADRKIKRLSAAVRERAGPAASLPPPRGHPEQPHTGPARPGQAAVTCRQGPAARAGPAPPWPLSRPDSGVPPTTPPPIGSLRPANHGRQGAPQARTTRRAARDDGACSSGEGWARRAVTMATAAGYGLGPPGLQSAEASRSRPARPYRSPLTERGPPPTAGLFLARMFPPASGPCQGRRARPRAPPPHRAYAAASPGRAGLELAKAIPASSAGDRHPLLGTPLGLAEGTRVLGTLTTSLLYRPLCVCRAAACGACQGTCRRAQPPPAPE